MPGGIGTERRNLPILTQKKNYLLRIPRSSTNQHLRKLIRALKFPLFQNFRCSLNIIGYKSMTDFKSPIIYFKNRKTRLRLLRKGASNTSNIHNCLFCVCLITARNVGMTAKNQIRFSGRNHFFHFFNGQIRKNIFIIFSW